jgi:hypothetical protein
VHTYWMVRNRFIANTHRFQKECSQIQTITISVIQMYSFKIQPKKKTHPQIDKSNKFHFQIRNFCMKEFGVKCTFCKPETQGQE